MLHMWPFNIILYQKDTTHWRNGSILGLGQRKSQICLDYLAILESKKSVQEIIDLTKENRNHLASTPSGQIRDNPSIRVK